MFCYIEMGDRSEFMILERDPDEVGWQKSRMENLAEIQIRMHK